MAEWAQRLKIAFTSLYAFLTSNKTYIFRELVGQPNWCQPVLNLAKNQSGLQGCLQKCILPEHFNFKMKNFYLKNSVITSNQFSQFSLNLCNLIDLISVLWINAFHSTKQPSCRFQIRTTSIYTSYDLLTKIDQTGSMKILTF